METGQVESVSSKCMCPGKVFLWGASKTFNLSAENATNWSTSVRWLFQQGASLFTYTRHLCDIPKWNGQISYSGSKGNEQHHADTVIKTKETTGYSCSNIVKVVKYWGLNFSLIFSYFVRKALLEQQSRTRTGRTLLCSSAPHSFPSCSFGDWNQLEREIRWEDA